MENKEMKVLFVDEKTALQSIISDLFTFGCLFGGFFLNQFFFDGSIIMQLFLCIMILFLLSGRHNKKIIKMSPSQALEFLNKKLS